jgi:hypothetical protein
MFKRPGFPHTGREIAKEGIMGNVSLRILVLYGDKPGGQLGREVTGALRQKLGSEFQVRQSSWNLHLFRSSKLRALAALEAAVADMIILATNEGAPLPRELAEWFSLWRDGARATPVALVALLKRESPAAPRLIEKALH